MRKKIIYRYDFVCLYIWIKFIVSFTFVSSKTDEKKSPNKTKNDPQRLRIWHTYKWHFFGSCSLGANHIDEKNTHWTNATREKTKIYIYIFRWKMMRRKTLPPDQTHDTLPCNIYTNVCLSLNFLIFLKTVVISDACKCLSFRFVYTYTQFKLLDNVIHV